MNKSLIAILATLILCAAAGPSTADNRMIAGFEDKGDLIATGATDVATAPGRIATETGEDLHNFGAGGLITGPIVGSIKGAGQAAKGGARVLIGILDILSAPIRESRYNRTQSGSLR